MMYKFQFVGHTSFNFQDKIYNTKRDLPLSVFDFLFDGFLADVMVQSKINKAKDAVDRTIPQVESALNKLKSFQK